MFEIKIFSLDGKAPPVKVQLAVYEIAEKALMNVIADYQRNKQRLEEAIHVAEKDLFEIRKQKAGLLA